MPQQTRLHAATQHATKALLVAAAAIALSGHPAAAHHPLGGQAPSGWMEGLLSGLAHPLIESHHAGMMLAVALLAAWAGRPRALPLTFLLALGAGLATASLFATEASIIQAATLAAPLATVAAGLLLLRRPREKTPLLPALLATGGLAHGYAYAELTLGVDATAAAAYIGGLVVVNAAFITLIAAAARKIAMTGMAARPQRASYAFLIVLLGAAAFT